MAITLDYYKYVSAFISESKIMGSTHQQHRISTGLFASKLGSVGWNQRSSGRAHKNASFDNKREAGLFQNKRSRLGCALKLLVIVWLVVMIQNHLSPHSSVKKFVLRTIPAGEGKTLTTTGLGGGTRVEHSILPVRIAKLANYSLQVGYDKFVTLTTMESRAAAQHTVLLPQHVDIELGLVTKLLGGSVRGVVGKMRLQMGKLSRERWCKWWDLVSVGVGVANEQHSGGKLFSFFVVL